MNDKHLDFAKALAEDAGKIMLENFKPDVEQRIKEDKTLVTIADEKINQLVIDRVEKVFPEHRVLGEEASNTNEHEYAWICDPIDGTNPYAKGLPVSTFSLALARDGRPILGVILDPFTNSLYSAISGRGAYLNNEPIKVSSTKLGHGAVINVDWWPTAEVDSWQAVHDLAKSFPLYPLSIGSVVRASTLVASGKMEAAVFPGTKGKFMDIAAAKVIVEEAGGKVTDFGGKEQRYDQAINGAVVSNGVVHKQITEALKKVS